MWRVAACCSAAFASVYELKISGNVVYILLVVVDILFSLPATAVRWARSGSSVC